MRVTLRKFSPGLLPALLTAVVFLTASGSTNAQSTTRSFQMALWTDLTHDANSDIAVFWGGQPQPAGRSIWVNGPITTSLPDSQHMDWSRIVAVEFDEPYGPNNYPASLDSSLRLPDGTPACQVSLTALNEAIAPQDAQLALRAAELRARAPQARFWVNFTTTEAQWMATCIYDPLAFNRAYIDVVSTDWYDADFSTIQQFYSVIAANRPKPDQQLALIPGVYSAPNNQLQYLQGYFSYADSMNQSCNLPLGARGVTGYFDGCPVWVVLGWLSYSFAQGNTEYVGMLDPNSVLSGLIATNWEAELALPLRPGLAHQRSRAQVIQPALQLLLQ